MFKMLIERTISMYLLVTTVSRTISSKVLFTSLSFHQLTTKRSVHAETRTDPLLGVTVCAVSVATTLSAVTGGEHDTSTTLTGMETVLPPPQLRLFSGPITCVIESHTIVQIIKAILFVMQGHSYQIGDCNSTDRHKQHRTEFVSKVTEPTTLTAAHAVYMIRSTPACCNVLRQDLKEMRRGSTASTWKQLTTYLSGDHTKGTMYLIVYILGLQADYVFLLHIPS